MNNSTIFLYWHYRKPDTIAGDEANVVNETNGE